MPCLERVADQVVDSWRSGSSWLPRRNSSTAAAGSGRPRGEALSGVAILQAQPPQLGVILDAFAEGLKSQRLAELDECVHQRGGFG